MRKTHFFGFTDEAIKWLQENVVSSIDTDEKITGMFGEEIQSIREHTTRDGRILIDYVQAEPWSSGPCIFLALKWKDTDEPIKESLWDEEIIDNC
jgi:hypothetical protein